MSIPAPPKVKHWAESALAAGACAVLAGCGLTAGLRSACGPETYIVNTTDEGDDPEAICVREGDPCTLRAAINTANFCRGAGHKTVRLQGGVTYTLTRPDEPPGFLRRQSLAEEARVGATGLPRVFGSLTIESTGPGVATISRSELARERFRHFHVTPGGQLRLERIRVTGGRTAHSLGSDGAGAGLYNDGRLSLVAVTLDDNRATVLHMSRGGALYNTRETSIVGGSIHRNTAGRGAAIFNADGLVWVEATAFVENRSTQSDREGNSIIFSSGDAARVQLRDVTLQQNIANDAPVIVQGGSMLLDGAVVHGNIGIGSGGLSLLSGSLTIRRSTVHGNTGREVGGVRCANTATALLIEDSTITGSRGEGGFLPVGVSLECAVDIGNTIVADHAGADCAFGESTLALGINLSSDGSCLRFALTHTDPGLGELSDNGGPTSTRLPSPGSPVIDAGGTTCNETDQRGIPREDGRCDIGAVERAAGDG